MCGWFNLAQELMNYTTCQSESYGEAADQLPAVASCTPSKNTVSISAGQLIDTRCTWFLAEKGADVRTPEATYLHVEQRKCT